MGILITEFAAQPRAVVKIGNLTCIEKRLDFSGGERLSSERLTGGWFGGERHLAIMARRSIYNLHEVIQQSGHCSGVIAKVRGRHHPIVGYTGCFKWPDESDTQHGNQIFTALGKGSNARNMALEWWKRTGYALPVR